MSGNPYESLIPLFNKKSAVDRIEDFHSNINIIFHNIESKYYDTIHKEMWENLQTHFDNLVNAVLREVKIESNHLTLLDIGCGTGLSTEMVLKTTIGKEIKTISLLDTSVNMLEKAKERIKKWDKSITLINSEIESVEQTFDVIVICSVIHHIPDLKSFFCSIEKRLNTGGILITMHDPLATAIESFVYKNRVNQYLEVEKKYQSFLPRLIVKKINSKLKSFSHRRDLIEEVNEQLLKEEIIKTPLSHVEVWSVTDIHVEDLPYSNQKGISLAILEDNLTSMKIKKFITYCFFGTLRSDLVKGYKLKEDNLSKVEDIYGRNFGSIWIKN
jgi:2-polyprenyl-3-methyl-5-hydroxy-6-metoxy-1,4-benzoquinol methylase